MHPYHHLEKVMREYWIHCKGRLYRGGGKKDLFTDASKLKTEKSGIHTKLNVYIVVFPFKKAPIKYNNIDLCLLFIFNRYIKTV